MTSVVERFLKYVSFDTKSDEETGTVPSTKGQYVLAEEIVKELNTIGLSDVSVDKNGYIMATLPSNVGNCGCSKDIPVIGFIAHMDTSPDMSGENVKPRFIDNYDGKDIVLNAEANIVTAIKDFPELSDYIGKTLIVTDGTTLLGADDKAGIAEIITAMEYLIAHPEIKHGTIRIGFTPDEEIGCGADHFDVEKFNAKLAYTVDGGPIGELEFENFNAAGAKITIHGKSVHPGSAKNKMINSMLIANEFIAALPAEETPAKTEGYEGFYHLTGINGEIEKTTLGYIIRDFDMTSFENRKNVMTNTVKAFNDKYGDGTLVLDMKDSYFNMKEIIEKDKYIVDTAFEAMEAVGVTPLVNPIRGGTDGARLSFMGLPTPNIFTGGHNFHGKHEFIPTFAMEKAVEVILKIVDLYTNK
jgi:tripeptide aminopeptidase